MKNKNIKQMNTPAPFYKSNKKDEKEILSINSILPTVERKEYLSKDSAVFAKPVSSKPWPPLSVAGPNSNIRHEVVKSLEHKNSLEINTKIKTFSVIKNNLPSNCESHLFNNVVKTKLIKLLDSSDKNLDRFVLGNDFKTSNSNKRETQNFGSYRLSKIEVYTFNRQNSINNNINNKIKYCYIFLKHIFQNTFISTPNFKFTVNKLIITIYYFSNTAPTLAPTFFKGQRGIKQRGYCEKQSVYYKDFYNINLSLLQVEELLAKLFNINIELRFIKLHYPFLNSNIFANFIGHLILGNFTSNLIKKDSKFLDRKRKINKQIENFETYSINSFNLRQNTKNKKRRRFNLVKLFKKMKLIRVNKAGAAVDNIKNNLFNNLNFTAGLNNYNTTIIGQSDKLYGKNNLDFNTRNTIIRGDSTQFSSTNDLDSGRTSNQNLELRGGLNNTKTKINNIFEKYQSKLALLGAKYEIAGRMNRRRSATRTSVISRSKGSFKFNSKNSLIDHSRFIYKNKNGSFSVKVWLSSNYSL